VAEVIQGGTSVVGVRDRPRWSRRSTDLQQADLSLL